MVRIAIIGNNSVGKSTFIDYMKLYGTENCTYHEFSFDSDCNMKFDSYVYLLDCAQNKNSIKEQLARINTDIKNCIIVGTKIDRNPIIIESKTLENLQQEVCGKELSTVYFSHKFNSENCCLKILRTVYENWIKDNEKKISTINNFLNNIGFFALEQNEKIMINLLFYNYLKHNKKNCISEILLNLPCDYYKVENQEIIEFLFSYNFLSTESKEIFNKIIEHERIPQYIPPFEKYAEEKINYEEKYFNE